MYTTDISGSNPLIGKTEKRYVQYYTWLRFSLTDSSVSNISHADACIINSISNLAMGIRLRTRFLLNSAYYCIMYEIFMKYRYSVAAIQPDIQS